MIYFELLLGFLFELLLGFGIALLDIASAL